MMNYKNIYNQTNYENELRKLYGKKYGANNYDIAKDWYSQAGTPQATWSNLDEENARLMLQYLDTQRANQASALKQTQALYQGAEAQQAQLGVSNELVQKYLGNTLRAKGQATGGVAETTMAQAGNTYLSNLANINRDTTNRADDIYGAYQQALNESDINLSQAQRENQEAYDTIYRSQMEEELNSLIEGGYLNENTYKNIKEKYQGTSQGISQGIMNELDKTYMDYINTQNEMSKLGINPNAEKININTINSTTFGKFGDYAWEDGEQNTYINTIINRIQSNPKAYNGKVIDFNFGKGKSKYIVYNGLLYKTKNSAKVDDEFIQLEKEIKSKREKPTINFVAPSGI